MNKLDRNNFPTTMARFMEQSQVSTRQVAGVINCPEASLGRILAGSTYATEEMLRQGATLIHIGFEKFSKLSSAEREKLSSAIGTVSGGGVGFASVTAAVGAMGSVTGLSAAGIASGLAAIGALVGGGMAAGITIVAAIPIAGAGAGYGIVRAVKYVAGEKKLSSDALDPKWELEVNAG